MLKTVNLLKVLSMIIFLGTLILVYAYSPIMVQLRPESTELSLHKESFFYFVMAFFIVINLALLAFEKLYEPLITNVDIKAWVRGFTFVLNFYFALIIAFIGVVNNRPHLNASGFAYLNYIGPFLIFLWILGLLYLLGKRAKSI